MRRRYSYAALAEEADTQDTDAAIEEGEADKSDEAADEKESGKKEGEDYKPEEEDPKEDDEDKDDEEREEEGGDEPVEDAGEGTGEEGGDTGGGDDIAPEEPVEDATPAEEKPRHDNEINSTDIVVNASNVMRAAKEIVQDKQVSTEDGNNHDDIEQLYQQADGAGRSLGRVALELENASKEFTDLAQSCETISGVQDALADPYETHEVSNVGMEAIRVLVTRICERNGLSMRPMRAIANESYLGKPTDKHRHKIALEGFGDMFTAIIDAIRDAFRRIWKWIKDFFSVATDKNKKAKEISQKLTSRMVELKKRYDELNDEKKKQVGEIYALCQKFESDKVEETLTPIPETLKSSGDRIKKLIQEKGFRLKRSDLGTFYTTEGFKEPNEVTQEMFKGYAVIFEAICLRSGMLGDVVGDVLKQTNALLGIKEEEKQKAMGSLFESYKAFATALFTTEGSQSGFELCGNQDTIKELGFKNEANVQVFQMKALPGEKSLFFCDIASLDVLPKDPVDGISVAQQYNDVLCDIKVRLKDTPQASTKEDAYVGHLGIEKFEKSLAKFMDDYIDDVNAIMKAQVKRYEKVGKTLVDEIDASKKLLENAVGIDKAVILNLNALSAFISEVFASVIPNLSKLMITFALDYCKYINQSLNAFDASLEAVK